RLSSTINEKSQKRSRFAEACERGTRTRFGLPRVVHAPGACAIDQRAPRADAGRPIAPVLELHFGDALQENRIAGVARVEFLQQFEGASRVSLVPEVDQMELVVRFSANEGAFLSRLQHFLQTLHAIAAGQE